MVPIANVNTFLFLLQVNQIQKTVIDPLKKYVPPLDFFLFFRLSFVIVKGLALKVNQGENVAGA